MNIQNTNMHQRKRLLHQTPGSSMLRVALEEDTLCKARTACRLAYVTPSDFGVRRISDSRIFLWVSCERTKWPGNDFSLVWAECGSSRGLCQATLVRGLYKSVGFGSRFSSGGRLQSSSKGRIGLGVPFLSAC